MTPDFGLFNGRDGLVLLHKYSRGWGRVPAEFRTKGNFETYCYLRYMGMDALAMFADEIRKIKHADEK